MTSNPQVKPDSAEMWYKIGNDHLEKFEYVKALAAYGKAIEKIPGNEKIWYGKGITLFRLGKHEEAKIVFDRALFLEPYHTYGCGEFFFDTDDARQMAVDRYDKKLQSDPDDSRIIYAKGLALVNLASIKTGLNA